MKKTFEISENTALYSAKVEELVKMVEFGDIALPVVQRPVVWNDEQVEKLGDTIARGWAYGSLSLAKVEGSKAMLLVDGLQRFTALKRIHDEKWAAFDGATVGEGITAEELAELEKAANEFSEHEVLLTVTEGTLNDSAELFLRLNNGTPLSKIQRSTGGMKPRVLEWARGFQKLVEGKTSGKLSADECALVFAACAQMPRKASTNGGWAVKTLTSLTDDAKLVEVAKFEKAAEDYFTACEIAGNNDMRVPMRAIPYIIGSAMLPQPLTDLEWLVYLGKKGVLDAEKVKVWSAETGKNNTRTGRTIKIGTAFESRSNGNKATCERLTSVQGLAKLIRTPEKAQDGADEIAEDAEDVKATAAAMAEMMEG